MKFALLSLVLSSAAFAYEARLYPSAHYIEMYNCDRGVQASFHDWTGDKATLELKDFVLAGPGEKCAPIPQNKRLFVLTKQDTRTGTVWFGYDSAHQNSARVYDYRNGAGPNARPSHEFSVWEFNEHGGVIHKLYPPFASRG